MHSLLHEAAHLIVLPAERRAAVHTDATDSIEEEDAVCVLQSLLGDAMPGVGGARVLADMDAWGYTFRLGSARAYVEHDADAAWMLLHRLGSGHACAATAAAGIALRFSPCAAGERRLFNLQASACMALRIALACGFPSVPAPVPRHKGSP